MKKDRIHARQSNIELLRVLLALLILAQAAVHAVGLTEELSAPVWQRIFLQFFGSFGTAAGNCFVLITGFFMVTGKTSFTKWLKLYLQIKFYTILIYLIFLLTGQAARDWHEALRVLFSTVFGVGNRFAESYLLLYLLIPFINLLIERFSAKSFASLLGLLLLVATVFPTLTIFLSGFAPVGDAFSLLPWMLLLYLLGAFLRINRYRILREGPLSSRGRRLLLLAGIVLLNLLWIVFYELVGASKGWGRADWFVEGPNKLLAAAGAVVLFVCFLSLDFGKKPWINRIAAATFGVCLICAEGNGVCEFLWRGLFRVTEHPASPWLPLLMIAAVPAVFAVCALIDLLRRRFLEEPIFRRVHIEKRRVIEPRVEFSESRGE